MNKERILIELAKKERDLILNLTMVDPAVSERLETAQPNNHKIIPIFITIDELEDILENVAADANHARSEKLKRELDFLYDKLQSILDEKAF
jgi:hypothetical protein